MVDFNNNVLYQAKQIFFKSNKIFILNLLSFLVIALLFGIGQHYFQKKNNLLNKHTVIIENVPIIPTNDKVRKTENLKSNYRIVSKTYPKMIFKYLMFTADYLIILMNKFWKWKVALKNL